MAVIKTDNFVGVNGTDLNTYDSNWQKNNSAGGAIIYIQSNGYSPTSATGGTEQGYRWNATFANDQYAQCVWKSGANTSYAGVGVRHAAAATHSYYVFYCDPISQYFAKVVNGTYTDLQTNTNTTTNANDILYIQAVGNVITAKRNGTNAFTPTTDNSLSSGVAGVTAFLNGGITIASTFEGGNVGGGVVGRSMLMGVG